MTAGLLRLEITLNDVEPAVRRVVDIPSGLRLDHLHRVIQTAMGWENCHLHTFDVGDVSYGVPDPDWDLEDERTVSIQDLVKSSHEITYSYDMGDGWEHTIRVLDVPSDSEGRLPFKCVEGANACPPEDCGGPWGYTELVEALADKKHEGHDELVEWLGGGFDATKFDLDDTNRRLKRLGQIIGS